MKSKVIIICVLLFCSKIVDSIPHSENHVRQSVNPLSNWQVNKKVPNAQYVDTDYTQPRNVNELTNSAIQQENNEDYYSNQRGYNYDGYGYNKGPVSSTSAKELLVNYDSPADGRRLESYPPRVESHPSHTSQVGFDNQQYRNQKFRSQNPFTNSVPSSVFIPNDERPLVTSVQEPYRGLTQYVQPKYIPSSNRRSHQPGRSYLTREQLQYPSVDHSGVNTYVANPATRFGSGGLVPFENYSKSQASETKTRPTGVRRHLQDFGSPSEVNYEAPAVESSDTLVDQSENIRYPVPYENYRESRVSETKTRPTGIRRHVQDFGSPSEVNYEAPAVESSDTLVDQSENIRYPVPYENYRESRVSETKTRPTGIRKHVQDSEINYETPAVEPPVTLVDQSENIKYPVPYENYREGQVSDTKTRPTGVRRHIQNIENPSEINYETPAVESIDTLVDQSENIRYPVPYENYREGQVSGTKTRLTGIRKHVQNSEIIHETPAVEPPVTLVDQSENIRYLVPYENNREGQVSETKTGLTGVRRHVQDFKSTPKVNYETPAVESPDTLVDQFENIRYPVPYKNYREGQVSEIKTRLTGVRRHLQDFATPSKINYVAPAVESPDTDEFENIRYVENSRSGSHLSNSAPITSYDDGTPVISDTVIYSSDSRPRNLVPIVNVKKEATVEISNILADKPLARKYANRSDYRSSNIARDNSNNDAPTDITKTIEVKESKYGANYAEEKAVPVDTYPEDSLTPTNTVLENSGSHTYEESNVPKYGSSSHNNLKQNAIHHLTSEIKELSLKSLVANPEIQHILSRTDKRYVVVHPNGTVEFFDTLPLDSQQDSKLRLVHTKRKNIDGSKGDGVLTPQWPQNLPSNIANNHAPVDEYPSATINQPADEYNSNPFENLPAGYSNLKPLPPHEEQPADNENSKLLTPAVNQSADGGYSKPLIPNEDQPVYSNSNQPKDDDNSKSLAPNEAQPAYDANPKPTPENQSGDDDNSNPFTRDVNHPTDDDILKHWNSPENQPRDDDSSKPLLTDANQSKDKINLTPYARNPVHVKRHKHAYVTHPANDNTFKLLLPNEAQPRDDTKPKHSNGNQPENDDNSNPSSPNKNQPADDINSEPLNENLSGDDIVPKLLHPYYRHHKKSKLSHVDEPAEGNNSNLSSTPEPLDYPENLPGDDNPAKPLSSNENQSGHNKNPKPSDTNENQTDDDNYSEPLPSHNRHEDDDNSNLALGNQQGDDIAAEPFTSNEVQSEVETDSRPTLPHKKPRPHHKKTKHSHINRPAYNDSSKLLPSPVNQPREDNNPNSPYPSHGNEPAEGNNSNSLSTPELLDYPENLPGDDHSAKSLSLNENQSGHNKNPKPSDKNENQTDDDNYSEPLPSHNRHVDDDNSNLELGNQQGDDIAAEPFTSNEVQSEVETDSRPTLPHKKPRPHHKKTKHSHINRPAYDDSSKLLPTPVNQPREDNNPNSPNPSHGNEPADDNNSKQPSSDENHSEDDKKSKLSKPLPGNEPADDNNIKSPSSYKNQPAGDKTPKQLADETESTPSPHKKQRAYRNKSKSKHSPVNQPADDNASPETQPEDKISKPLPTQTIQHSRGNQPTNDSTTKPLPSIENDISPDKQPENDDSSKPSLSPENRPVDDNDFKPLPPNKRRPVHRNKSKHSKVNKPANDNNSNPASPEKNPLAEDNGSKPLPSNANQPKDDTDSTPSLSHKKQPAHHKKPKHSHVDLESEDHIANPSFQGENQQIDDKADENQSGDETITTPLPPYTKQRVHPRHSRVNKSVDDNNSKTSPDETENQSTNDNNSKPSPPEHKQLENYIKSKPTPSVSSKNDDESKSTTLSPPVPSYTTTPKQQAIKKYKRKHSHRKTATNSPVVSTTSSPDDSSEDQIITLSPIEQVTDNVSDVPTLTTTTAKPVKTSDIKDTYKDSNNKPDEAQDDTKSSSEDLASISDKVQTSTTTATPSTSTSRTDNARDDKTKGKSQENENVAVVSKENNGKDNTQTAAYNSSELLDTNTDVPEETDDYSPVTPSPSDQNDVGDASCDNSSELEQSETDVTITVSSSTTYDSEDEIITINIEVSESTDDADSPSNDKTLVVSIDTNPDNDDDSKALQTDVSKTTKTEDCKDDHNHDDGRGKNVEIDFSNLKGEPTMWIKTTNQDFIDELIAKNDTQFDVIYFFSIENQPIIEREKEATIFCNGTVVVETTEITYADKDDLTPTIIKTTEIMQIEDYEQYK